jgi:hypothetical protein
MTNHQIPELTLKPRPKCRTNRTNCNDRLENDALVLTGTAPRGGQRRWDV